MFGLKRFFILTLFSLLISNISVLAHGIGGGEDKTVDNFKIDFGYNIPNPSFNEPLLITFNLYDKLTGNNRQFNSAQIKISNNKKELLFRDFAYPDIPGRVTLVYTFPDDDLYTIDVGFVDDKKKLVETSFALQVGSPKKSFLSSIVSFFIKIFGRNENTDLKNSNSVQSSVAESPEIKEIKKLKQFSAGSKIYRNLIERVGPQQAQEELYRSGLPFGGESHLLNHVSGEYLYEKFGAAGLIQCKDYFLSSCYHGFTIELIADEGLSGVNKVLEQCQKKGFTTLAQCMHAMGHGFVSWVGYSNLDKALELCDEAGLQIANPPLRNCYDGVFMENVWGVHEGVPSHDRWVDDNDPLYPCYDSRIDSKYRMGCLGNSATLMLNTFEGNLTKSGELCQSIVDSTERRVCFDGVARQLHTMAFGHVDEVYELCSNMPENWTNFCVAKIAVSDTSIGGRQLPFEICNRIDESYSDTCHEDVLNSLNAYTANSFELLELCKKFQNSKWREKCINRASYTKR